MSDPNRELPHLLDHLDSAVLWLNPDLKLQYANPSAEMLLEKSLSHLRGQSIENFCDEKSELVALLLHTRGSERSITRREYQLNLASGKTVTVNLTISAIAQVGLIVEIQSIARVRSINNESKLQREYSAIQELIRGLAHEIKNPLGGIRGAAQLLKAELSGQPELGEYTDVLIKEVDRLKTLIDRMSGPRKQPVKNRVNIHEVCERVRTLIRAEACSNIDIRHEYDPSLPEIFADKDQLIQATLNVARNAMESLGEHGGKIIISTSIIRKFTIGQTIHPLVVSLKIKDNGAGIPETLQPQIFLPMVTGKATGTGLGLPTTRALIDAQGGIIRFSSWSGHTEFEILLPIAET